MINARSVNSWADLPGACPSQAQIVQQVIQVLVIDRISHVRRQHTFWATRPSENSAAMSPTANGLKTLRLINNDISTASGETAGQGSDYKRQQFQPADGAQQK